jgi:hypothetical protein
MGPVTLSCLVFLVLLQNKSLIIFLKWIHLQWCLLSLFLLGSMLFTLRKMAFFSWRKSIPILADSAQYLIILPLNSIQLLFDPWIINIRAAFQLSKSSHDFDESLIDWVQDCFFNGVFGLNLLTMNVLQIVSTWLPYLFMSVFFMI